VLNAWNITSSYDRFDVDTKQISFAFLVALSRNTISFFPKPTTKGQHLCCPLAGLCRNYSGASQPATNFPVWNQEPELHDGYFRRLVFTIVFFLPERRVVGIFVCHHGCRFFLFLGLYYVLFAVFG